MFIGLNNLGDLQRVKLSRLLTFTDVTLNINEFSGIKDETPMKKIHLSFVAQHKITTHPHFCTSIMKLSIMLLLVSLVYGYVSAEKSRKFCGTELSKIVANLCWDVEMVKRGGGWWMPHAPGRMLGGMRDKRGLVDECCFKPCTIDELLTYC